jgi:hypothetical protein
MLPKKMIAQKASSKATATSAGTTATSEEDSHLDTTTVNSTLVIPPRVPPREGVCMATNMDVVTIWRGVYTNNCIYQSLVNSNRSVYQLLSPELKPDLSRVMVPSVQETGGCFLPLGWDNLYYKMSHAEGMAVTFLTCSPQWCQT